MGGFRDGPLIGKIPWVVPLLLWAIPLPSWSCDSQLNPQAFQSNIPNQSDFLPNGMMAIRYAGTGEEISPHVSVHRVMMTLPGRQLTIPEAKNPRVSRCRSRWDHRVDDLSCRCPCALLWDGAGWLRLPGAYVGGSGRGWTQWQRTPERAE